MKWGRREAEERQVRRNRKDIQMGKNIVTVYADGDVFASDDNLRELAESRMYYNPALDRWMVRTIRGATVKHV